MQVARSADALKQAITNWKDEGLKVGFVPTMGALHDGHLSLIEIAAKHSDRIVASIFVNPTQFAPHEDFSAYPRDEKSDLQKLEGAGTHLVYLPQQSDIYPVVAASDLKAGKSAQGLEADIRPTHFDGVATVVARLFKQVKPDIAVFGEKDYQQLCVIKDMVAAQNFPVEIIPCPIVRDEQGLALSSRNAYLSPAQLGIARRLNKILFETASLLKNGNPENALQSAKKKLLAAGFSEVQYLELRDAETLAPAKNAKNPSRLLAAVKLGNLRLIDNIDVGASR